MQTPATRPKRVVAWSLVSDEMLAARAAGGNAGAFEALYARYHGPLLGYARSILLDTEDARDATQNALERALRALPAREPGRPLRPWLYRIAHNEAIAIMRRRRPQTELVPALEPTVPGPEVDAERRGRLAQLVDDLRTLPERQRGALVMRELSGLSYDEIGCALGLSNEAARRAVFDARNALHDALDGRAAECVSVRHSISDGDRRSLRARGIRAHLRSCDACASFQRSIGARRTDLHALAPWVSGAAVMGAVGGAGGGGALLTASGGASASAAGGGAGWAGLSLAVKGLALAAAVVTTGTAAVEIKHAAEPGSSPAKARTAQPRRTPAGAIALHAAALAAAAASRSATPPAAPTRSRERVRAKVPATGPGGPSTARAPHRRAPLSPATTAPAAVRGPAPAAAAPQTTSAVTAPGVAAPHVPTTAVKAIDELGRLRDEVQQAFAEADAITADGTPAALALATGMLDRTLGPLRSAIDGVLATLGLRLPGPAGAPTQTADPAPTPAQTTPASVLAPVRQVLEDVQALLRRLLGRP